MQVKTRYQESDTIGGRYQVYRVLAGARGEVYLCLDLVDDVPLALKTFRAGDLTGPEARADFEREVGLWVAMEQHPNIVRCYYMDTIDDQPFLFLEWVAGEEAHGTDLRDWLDRRGAMEPRQALDLAIHICRGLAHAATRVNGFVHCDLKPDNVLLAQDGLAKVTDFGLARVVRDAGLFPSEPDGEGAGRRPESNAGGTPHYMAPEQWRNEPVDARTDVYASGCVLYEVLTGRPLFDDKGARDRRETWKLLERQHLESTPPALTLPRDEPLADLLGPVLSRCLAKDPSQRYASPSVLLDELTRVYQARWSTPPRAAPEPGVFTAADYNNRGATYHLLGRHAEALEDYAAALRLDPNAVLTHSNRAATYTALGRHAEALEDYSAVLRIDPNHAQAYLNRSVIRKALGRYAEALEDYSAALRIDPSLAKVYYDRGNTYADLGRHAEALEDYSAALRIDPNDARAYFNRGNTYAALGRNAEALKDFAAALQLDPNDAHAYYNRGATYSTLGRHAEALEDYTAAVRLDPNDAQTHVNLGVLHANRQEWPDALRGFEAAERLGDPKGAEYAMQVRQILGKATAPLARDTRRRLADG